MELFREIGLSYTLSINSSCLTFMYDIKEWMENVSVQSMSGHIHQHQFKLVRGEDGKAEMFYKKWSTTPKWSPEGAGIRLLDGLPSGLPKLIQPDVSKLNIEKLKQDIPKYSLHFDLQTKKWWENFLDNEAHIVTPSPNWILPMLNVQEENRPIVHPVLTEEQKKATEQLAKLVQKEERQEEVLRK